MHSISTGGKKLEVISMTTFFQFDLTKMLLLSINEFYAHFKLQLHGVS